MPKYRVKMTTKTGDRERNVKVSVSMETANQRADWTFMGLGWCRLGLSGFIKHGFCFSGTVFGNRQTPSSNAAQRPNG